MQYLLLLAISSHFGATDLSSIAEVLNARDMQLESLACTYRLVHKKNGKETWAKRQELRFAGKDTYLAQDDVMPDGTSVREIAASYRGLVTTFVDLTKDSVPVRAPSGIVGRETWPYPLDAYLTPQILLGTIRGKHIGGYLNEGVVTTDGEDMVITADAPRYSTCRILVVDSEYRLKRFIEGSIPSQEVTAKLAAAPDSQGLDIFWPEVSYEIEEYQQFDGVEIPIRGSGLHRRIDRALVQRLQDDFLNDAISAEAFVKATELEAITEAVFKESLVVDSESVRVNFDPKESDFKVTFTEGTVVVDKLANFDFVVGQDIDTGIGRLVERLTTVEPAITKPADAALPAGVENSPAALPIETRRQTGSQSKLLLAVACGAIAAFLAVILARRALGQWRGTH